MYVSDLFTFRALRPVARHFAGRRLGGAGRPEGRDAFSSERLWVVRLGVKLEMASARIRSDQPSNSSGGVLSRLFEVSHLGNVGVNVLLEDFIF